MGRSDLDTVAARRAEIARDLKGLEQTRAVLAAEVEELEVTERVLIRIDRLSHAETTFPASYVVDEPIHRRAMDVIRSLVGGRDS